MAIDAHSIPRFYEPDYVEYEPEYENLMVIKTIFTESGNVYNEYIEEDEAEEWRKSFLEEEDEVEEWSNGDPCIIQCWTCIHEVGSSFFMEEDMVWELVFN